MTPTLSVKHGENHVELTAELPGIQPSDVQVEVRKNLLHIYVVKTEDGSDRCVFVWICAPAQVCACVRCVCVMRRVTALILHRHSTHIPQQNARNVL